MIVATSATSLNVICTTSLDADHAARQEAESNGGLVIAEGILEQVVSAEGSRTWRSLRPLLDKSAAEGAGTKAA
jgi:hypothetical protein